MQLKYVKKGLNTKAIIPVDLYGLPSNYEKINSISKKLDLHVIADAAQSFGATFQNKKVGSLTEILPLHFFPAKPLGVMEMEELYLPIVKKLKKTRES